MVLDCVFPFPRHSKSRATMGAMIPMKDGTSTVTLVLVYAPDDVHQVKKKPKTLGANQHWQPN